MKSGRPKTGEPVKTTVIQIRVTDFEKAQAKEVAASKGVTIADLFRSTFLNSESF